MKLNVLFWAIMLLGCSFLVELSLDSIRLSAKNKAVFFPEMRSPCTGGSGTYRDEFTAVSYSNTQGTVDWSANPWMEFNDGNDATGNSSCFSSGFVIYVAQSGDCTYSTCPNSNNCLTFNTIGEGVNDYVSRQFDLDGVITATLTFDYNINFSGSDAVDLEVRTGGSPTWTNLATYNSSSSGTANINLDAHLAIDTELRFIETGANGGFFAIDNFQIAFTCCSTSPSAGAVNLTKN